MSATRKRKPAKTARPRGHQQPVTPPESTVPIPDLVGWICEACQGSCNPVLLRCPRCGALRRGDFINVIRVIALAQLKEYAPLFDAVDLLDQLLRLGIVTDLDILRVRQLDEIQWHVEREGARKEYLRLQLCDRDRELLQRYRPALYARIVAEGEFTPSQQRRRARKGA